MKKKHTLSKTDYIQYLDCPEELWLRKNKPKLLPPIDLDRQYKLDQGNLIDEYNFILNYKNKSNWEQKW